MTRIYSPEPERDIQLSRQHPQPAPSQATTSALRHIPIAPRLSLDDFYPLTDDGEILALKHNRRKSWSERWLDDLSWEA